MYEYDDMELQTMAGFDKMVPKNSESFAYFDLQFVGFFE